MTKELQVKISAEIGDLKKKTEEAKQSISSFVSTNIKDMDKFKDGIQKAGDHAKNFLKVTAGAVAGVATALTALGPATKEYREGQAKLATAFETAGASADTAKGVYNDLYRVLGDSDVSVEAANHLAKLTTNQQELSEWTTICEGVYATFGDSLPIEGLTEAANETAKTGSLTGVLADALNWAGVAEDDFQAKLDACNTEAEREQLIRETLTGLYDEAAAGYEKNAQSILAQNEAQAKMTDAMAKLGEATEPIMTMLTELGAEILADLTPYVQDFADKYMPQIQEALSGVGEKIGEVITWIADHWELIATIGGIVLAIATAISVCSTALSVYNTVMAITEVVTLPMIGTIAAIVAGIAALIAIIVICVKHWDDITAAVKNFATSVGEFFSGLWDSITEWISGIAESISNWWNDTKEGFSDWWDGIKEGWSNFWSGVGEKVSAGVENVKTKFNDMKDKVSSKVEEMKSAVKDKFESIKSSISEKVEGAKKVVSEKYNQMKETMGTVMEAAKTTVKQKLDNIKQAYEENGGGIKGIAAAAMEGVKGYFSAGLTFIDNLTGGKLSSIANTMRDKMNDAKNTVSNILGNIKNAFNDKLEGAKQIVSGAIEKIKGFFNFKWELPKLKLPHFSITGKFSLNPPSIPHFSVDWYAKGGVFDNPTLFPYGGSIGGLGEDGAEAVVPLEKNTQWLDRIAERLAKKQGATPIILQVDGKTFATTSISSINQLTKQTGKLDLVIV